MTNEELKNTMLAGTPVLHTDFRGSIEYKCISGIIYRCNKQGGIYIQVELLDKNLNCIVIAEPEKITIKINEV